MSMNCTHCQKGNLKISEDLTRDEQIHHNLETVTNFAFCHGCGNAMFVQHGQVTSTSSVTDEGIISLAKYKLFGDKSGMQYAHSATGTDKMNVPKYRTPEADRLIDDIIEKHGSKEAPTPNVIEADFTPVEPARLSFFGKVAAFVRRLFKRA